MELQGWKQIAPYLHVTERTAQNWARRQRMPVHHLPGSKGRVFAQTGELDAWKLTGPSPAPVPVRHAITVRLPEDDLKNLRPLIETRFASMQEFVSRAVAQYAEQQLRAPTLSR
ncbi:MAG TPA: hypothetical protein VE957_04460 [Terriglobales bacterium]|nr:hypothetical protein [Terriglobales bacterium]